MVPCHTPLYTLISMYLWGSFEVKPVLAASCHRQLVRRQASAMDMVMPTEELVQIRSSQAHAHITAWTVISTSLYSIIFPCGLYTNSFCCGNMSSSTSHSSTDCCNQSFTGIDFGRPFVPLSYAEAHTEASRSATSSSSTTSSSFTPSSSSASTIISNAPTTSPPSAIRATPLPINQSSSSSSSHSAAIGAGVGVPLGVALLLGLGFLFYREHKQRLKLESLLGDNQPRGKHEKASHAAAMEGMPHDLGSNYRQELGGNYRHELGGNYGRELDSNPIYEANVTS
ncbi:hypothetical protein JMJ35_005990 [Cladonia borealis]|uniref:Uncharacterized protein n=1 Tax=Cladonia borealis TaxID=184061 RepID=A0AA39QY66_9LECA|nr:hypothetical protein JMJ35_005990 [Cladonia borealis]